VSKESNTVIFISVFGGFRVDDRRKDIEKYAFFYESGLVWQGDIKTEPPVRSKIFGFVLMETKRTC